MHEKPIKPTLFFVLLQRHFRNKQIDKRILPYKNGPKKILRFGDKKDNNKEYRIKNRSYAEYPL